MGKRALIFGASGVSGWSFPNEILHDYPKKGIWDGVVAMTNRPLKQEDSLWPADPRLQIVSGVNLLDSQEDVERAMKEKAEDVDEITHVYYMAYKASADLQQEYDDAVSMFKHAITAMDHLSPALEFVVLQLGAKIYGCHLLENHPTDYIHVPLSEDQPRLKDQLFYHLQLDWITEYAKNKYWTWCETGPDILVGFVPNQNFFSLPNSLGIYLSLFAAINGRGARCPFPGSEKSWVAKSNDSSGDMNARQTIHLSLHLTKEREGEGFNIADAKHPETWSSKWPQLCQYFGLEGTEPIKGETIDIGQYINNHIDTWKKLEAEHGLKKGIAESDLTFKGFEYWMLTTFDFDRHYDMTKIYSTPKDNPFREEYTVMQAWGGVFDRMKEARLIPKQI